MPSRTCRLRSSTSASPPTMIESVPLSAPVIPPLTGPSSMWTPFSASFDATSLVTAGDIVLMSMTTEPASAPSATPFAPRMTSSTSGESFTIVIVNSLPSAASLADPAGFAPAATTSSIFDAVSVPTRNIETLPNQVHAHRLPNETEADESYACHTETTP